MPHSFATTAELTCTTCTRPFPAELWLIVDTVERSDLLARIRDDALHNVACPHCNATNSADAPLLAYRPDREPVLIFTPRWTSDDATQQADAQGLLDLLKANLGATWDDRWLAEADTLPAGATSAPAAGGQNDVLLNTLVELINAPSWTEKQRIVEAHPALLSDAADASLARLADAQDDEGVRRIVTEHRELLRRCKTVGIVRALRSKPVVNSMGRKFHQR
jgi:hypothetical protein